MKYQSQTIIYRNRSVVFDHLVDPSKMKHWISRFSTATAPGALQVRYLYFHTTHIGGRLCSTQQGTVIKLDEDLKSLKAYLDQGGGILKHGQFSKEL